MENLPAIKEATQDLDLVPMPVMSVQQAVARLKDFQAFVQGAMVKGTDYGVIPGTPKPTLLKPGAEKLAEMYGLAPIPTTTHRVEDWEHGFFHYEVRVDLISKRTGQVVAGGIGSCNSKESRYARRWVFPNDVPEGIDRKTLQKRERTGRNGKPYTQYCIENDDIYTQVNTIHKMAKKRALIDATLSATRSSGMFTQDVEDWVDADVTEVPEEAPKYEAATKPTKPAPAPKDERKTPPAETRPPSHTMLIQQLVKAEEAFEDAGLAYTHPKDPEVMSDNELADRIMEMRFQYKHRGDPAPTQESAA